MNESISTTLIWPGRPFADGRGFGWDVQQAFTHVEAEPDAFETALKIMTSARDRRSKLYFVGNGGSAAIASHMAADFTKAGGFSAFALNDAAALTAWSNDCGYEKSYVSQLHNHLDNGDVVIAISSSGASRNIIDAVDVDHQGPHEFDRITLSGFNPGNPLRAKGDLNFYVPSHRYGVVEVVHLMILHAMLDSIVAQEVA
jgi:D-sedoheptulose 7-phosphate isomerase